MALSTQSGLDQGYILFLARQFLFQEGNEFKCLFCNQVFSIRDFNILHFNNCVNSPKSVIGFFDNSTGFKYYCKPCFMYKKKVDCNHQYGLSDSYQTTFAHVSSCSLSYYFFWWQFYRGGYVFNVAILKELLSLSTANLTDFCQKMFQYFLKILSNDGQYPDRDKCCDLKNEVLSFLEGYKVRVQSTRVDSMDIVSKILQIQKWSPNYLRRFNDQLLLQLENSQITSHTIQSVQKIYTMERQRNREVRNAFRYNIESSYGSTPNNVQQDFNVQEVNDYYQQQFQVLQRQNISFETIIAERDFVPQILFLQQDQPQNQDQSYAQELSYGLDSQDIDERMSQESIQDQRTPFWRAGYQTENELEDLRHPFVETMHNFLSRNVSSGISLEMVQAVLKKQGLTDLHIENLCQVDRSNVTETIFPCINPHLFLEIQYEYYDKQFYLEKMLQILQANISNEQHLISSVNSSSVSQRLVSLIHVKLEISKKFIKGLTREQINEFIDFGKIYSGGTSHAQLGSWQSIQNNLLPQDIRDHMFHYCIYYDHVYLPDDLRLYQSQDDFVDHELECPNCRLLQNLKVNRYLQDDRENKPQAFFIDFFLEQQLQSLLHDPFVYEAIQTFKQNVDMLKSNITSFWGSEYVRDIQDFCERNGKPRDLIYQENSLSIDILFDGGPSHEKSGSYTTDYAYFRFCDIGDGENTGYRGLHPLVFIPDFQYSVDKGEKKKKLMQIFFKRTFEILNQHGPLGVPIQIPVYRNNCKEILSYTLFYRITVQDTPSREKLGNTQGHGGVHGCGSCTAIARYTHGTCRYIQQECAGYNIQWQTIQVCLLNSMQQVRDTVLQQVFPYILYPGGLEDSSDQIQTPNTLHDPLLFNYRSFIADYQVSRQFKNQASFNKKNGYSREQFIGSYGSPIFVMYKGLGYIQQNVAHPIPPSHALLHGLCKDILAIIFGEYKKKGERKSTNLRYIGNISEQEFREFQDQCLGLVRERWKHIRKCRNASKQPMDFGQYHKRLKFDEMISFITIFRKYLFHEHNSNYQFENRHSQRSSQWRLFYNILDIFWRTIQLVIYSFCPEDIHLGEQEILQTRLDMYQNIVNIYRVLEKDAFVPNIKNNIHYLACNFQYSLSKLGSLHQYFEFSMERRIGVSKFLHVNQNFLQSFIHVSKIEFYRYQTSFLSQIKAQQVFAQTRYEFQVFEPTHLQNGTIEQRLQLQLSRFTQQDRRTISLKQEFPQQSRISVQQAFMKGLWEFQLKELLRLYANANPGFLDLYNRLDNFHKTGNQRFYKSFKIFKRGFVNDNQLFDTRLNRTSNYVSNFVRLNSELFQDQSYIFEIYYFVSFCYDDNPNQLLEKQEADLSIQHTDTDMTFFDLNRFMAVGVSFNSQDAGGHYEIANDLQVFNYWNPVQDFEVNSIGAFAAPVYIADPNNLLQGRRKAIFQGNNPQDIRVFKAPRFNIARKNDIYADDCMTLSNKTNS